MWMKNFGSTGCQRVCLVVAEIVKQLCFHGLVGIFGVDAVDVGPDHEFVSVHDVSDDRAREIRAVAAERGDPAIGSRADEAGDDGDDSVFEKWKQDFAPAAFRLL